jgi:hypothetical protein
MQDRYEHFLNKLSTSPTAKVAELREQESTQMREVLAAARHMRAAEEKQTESLEKARAARRVKHLEKRATLTDDEKLELIGLKEKYSES